MQFSFPLPFFSDDHDLRRPRTNQTPEPGHGFPPVILGADGPLAGPQAGSGFTRHVMPAGPLSVGRRISPFPFSTPLPFHRSDGEHDRHVTERPHEPLVPGSGSGPQIIGFQDLNEKITIFQAGEKLRGQRI